MLLWFSDYLSNRRQRVVIPGSMSEWKYIHSGVPHGSILGPLLFLIYINDIVSEIDSNIRLFADDTSLYMVVDEPSSAAPIMNADLNRIMQWADTWLVTFNPTKTDSLLITRKINKPHHPPLLMHHN